MKGWTQSDIDKAEKKMVEQWKKKPQFKERNGDGIRSAIKLGRARVDAEAVQTLHSVKQLVSDKAEVTEIGSKLLITLAGLTAGLNGDKGLMREHYTAKDRRKKQLVSRLSALTYIEFDCPVKVTYTRYTHRFMDWDNACASFKSIGDALEEVEIIKNDSPEIIKKFIPEQVKCKKIEQRMEILIEIF